MTFKPGVSGNPAGRKPGTTNPLTDLLKRKMDDTITHRGKVKKVKEAIVDELIEQAKNGNMRAQQMIYERVEGKVKQITELTGLDGGAIKFREETVEELLKRDVNELAREYREALDQSPETSEES